MEAYLAPACLVAFLALVAIVDLRTRRIPNWLTIVAASTALVLNVSRLGEPGAAASGGGLATGLLVFLPWYLAGGFGAGDVKAMAAAGAFLGPRGALLAATCTLLVGGLSALVLLAALRFKAARKGSGWRGREVRKHCVPYGVAIACGTAISLAWS